MAMTISTMSLILIIVLAVAVAASLAVFDDDSTEQTYSSHTTPNSTSKPSAKQDSTDGTNPTDQSSGNES